jgi:hypothetical protein
MQADTMTTVAAPLDAWADESPGWENARTWGVRVPRGRHYERRGREERGAEAAIMHSGGGIEAT